MLRSILRTFRYMMRPEGSRLSRQHASGAAEQSYDAGRPLSSHAAHRLPGRPRLATLRESLQSMMAVISTSVRDAGSALFAGFGISAQ